MGTISVPRDTDAGRRAVSLGFVVAGLPLARPGPGEPAAHDLASRAPEGLAEKE